MAINIFKGIPSFADFLWNTWLSAGKNLVDQVEANRRAEICAQCHNNVQMDIGLKVGCCGRGLSGVLNPITDKIIQNRTTPSDNQLKSCQLCGCYLRLKVWAPLEALQATKEDSNAWPDFCWMKDVDKT